ncbi:MAG TPA: hypothetical protein PLQ01_09870 [Methanothrix sp.]|nr:hypothetical protein [Methanothrix sp.]
MDGLSITLQPHESRTLQTKIRPRDCKSYGTYQVVVKLVADNGQEQGTRTSTFAVKDPASCTGGGSGGKQQGCTWTFNCENNVVKRLCIDQYGREYWQDYDNCNSYNPPRECINGVCVDTSTPGGSDQPKQTCNQQACQSQNKAIGTSYTKDGTPYQKYMECNCVDNQCKCDEVEKEIPCSGVISGRIFDIVTRQPIGGASISIEDKNWINSQASYATYSDNVGYYQTSNLFCPLNLYKINSDKNGYEPGTIEIVTDSSGNKYEANFYLNPIKTKAIWINHDSWKAGIGELDLKDFQLAGINTIFLSLGPSPIVDNFNDYTSFINLAYNKYDIKVHAMVLEDPSCAEESQHASSFETIEKILDYGKFFGIHLDTEPYVNWREDPPDYNKIRKDWNDYVTLVSKIYGETKKRKTILSAAIPPEWYSRQDVREFSGVNLEDLIRNLDFSVIMAYGDEPPNNTCGYSSATTIEERIEDTINIIKNNECRVVIGVGAYECFYNKDNLLKCLHEINAKYSSDMNFFSGTSIYDYNYYKTLGSS